MKAEIDYENKAKFFALYWGQDVLTSDMYGDGGTIYSLTMKEYQIQTGWLELKPLSSISDEDAIELMYLIESIDWVDQLDDKAWWGKTLTHKFIKGKLSSQTATLLVDFYRSKGYLLPWMGLSPNEIIEAGWVKYKEG